MGEWKKRLAIGIVGMLIHIIQEKWQEKKLAMAFFIDKKSVW